MAGAGPMIATLCTLLLSPPLPTTGPPTTLHVEVSPPLAARAASDLRAYLLDDRRAASPEQRAERMTEALVPLRRFLDPTCSAAGAAIRCSLVQAPLVTQVAVRGDLPFGLLESDLLRRASMRVGRRMPSEGFLAPDAPAGTRQWDPFLAKVERRLRRFVDERGYAGTEVLIRLSRPAKKPGAVHVELVVKLGSPLSWGDVTITGVAQRETSRMALRLRRLGGQFRPEVLRRRVESEERLLRQEGYVEAALDVIPTRRAGLVDIAIHVHRGPLLQVRFRGDLGVPESTLRKRLSFSASRNASQAQVEASVAALRAFYQASGYFRPAIRADDPVLGAIEAEERAIDAQTKVVRSRLGKRPDARRKAIAELRRRRQELRVRRRQAGTLRRDERSVTFTIARGVRTVCDSVAIAGLTTPGLAEQLLGDELLATHRPLLGRHDGRLIDSEIAADEVRIKDWLEARGWFVQDVSAQLLRRAPGRIAVVFQVIAQEPTLIRSIALSGVSDGEDDDGNEVGEDLYDPLLTALDIRPGSPLLEDSAQLIRRRSLRFYRTRGYPGTQVAVTMSLTADGAQFRIVVTEGRRVLYGGLLVSGLRRTDERAVRRVFDVRPGEPFDAQLFARAAAKLRAWRVFRRVNLTWLGLDQGRQRIWVHVAFEEGVSQTLDLSIGFSIADYFQVSARWRDRNLFGRAWSWDTRLIYGLLIGKRSELRSTLRMPRLFGPRTDLSIEPLIYYREPNRTAPFVDSDSPWQLERDDNQLILRTQIKASHRLGPLSSVSGTYAYASERTRADGETAAVTTGSATLEGNWLNVDNPFNPHRGFHLKGSVKLAAPILLGDAYFLSAMGHSAGFLPLGRLTLAAMLRGGILHELPGNRHVAPSDMYRLGGERTLRGFAQDSVRLFSAASIDSRSGLDGHAHRFAMGSLELRIPLGLQTAGSGLGLTLFSDAGIVDDGGDQLGISFNRAWSNGLALSYVLPIGPIGVVVAHQTLRPRWLEGEPEPADYQLFPALPKRLGYHISMGYNF
jgi:translocation and assembly module TamA